jgi:dUTP pyrophosphatase
MKLTVRIVNKSNNSLPVYETVHASGLDLKAFISEDIVLKPLERALVPTGLYVSIPEGYEAQVRPRSGLAIKHGITVLNTPGTIDADYRGEIKVILVNLSNSDYIVKNGERICQLVFMKVEQIKWIDVEILDETDRGEGGFGHTGLK